MTEVLIVRNAKDDIIEFTAKGHANHGVHGTDIVCAAASSIIQTAAMGIRDVALVRAIVTKESGKIILRMPPKSGTHQHVAAQAILETMFCGLADLAKQYPDNVKIKGVYNDNNKEPWL